MKPASRWIPLPVKVTQRAVAPYVFIAPFYVTFAVFWLWPVAFALYMSFTNWSGLEEPRLTGLDNYLSLAANGTFRLAFVNTVWYSAASLFLMVPMALLLAWVLNLNWLGLKSFFRLAHFLPHATSTVVVAIVFIMLYNRDFGLINHVLGTFGVPRIDWLGMREAAKPSVIILVLWRTTGYFMIYFLAGLQAIPRELYEAAEVDGANSLQAFLHITIPMLRHVVLLVAVIVTIQSFQIFEEPTILNWFSMGPSGGPGDAGLSLAQYLYRVGFQYMKQGLASSVGIVFFVVVFFLSLAQMRYLGIFREN